MGCYLVLFCCVSWYGVGDCVIYNVFFKCWDYFGEGYGYRCVIDIFYEIIQGGWVDLDFFVI